MAEDGTTVEFAALERPAATTGGWADGKLVLEDPEYCASVSFTVGSWIEMLDQVQRRLIHRASREWEQPAGALLATSF